MMGVAPEYQSAGVGYRLKLAQRESVLAQGLALITWTYDPLQARNAYLNIHKLGAVCRTYIRDYYGLMADGLNAGLPSDRLQVAWWIAGDRVRQRLSGRVPEPDLEALAMANAVGRTAAGLLTPGSLDLAVDAPQVGIEIPADYQAIRSADPGLALAWRLVTRQLLDAYFAAGYGVEDFAGRLVERERHSYYILCPEERHAH